MACIWSDGGWIDGEEFSLTAADRGAILGLGLFETMLSVNGRLKFSNRHHGRLMESCQRLGWTVPEIDLDAIAAELAIRNGLEEGRGRIRLTMTAGAGSIFDKAAGKGARIWITAGRADDAPRSVSVTLSPWRRNERSPLAGLKTASYAENILALDHARSRGFDETLFLNTSDHVCEAATSNVFLVMRGRVLTPPLDSGCLPGVGRSVVIDLARKAGLDCVETPLAAVDLENADEIFLTSAIRGPVPVLGLDQRSFPATPVADGIRAAWLDEITRR